MQNHNDFINQAVIECAKELHLELPYLLHDKAHIILNGAVDFD